MARRCFLCLSAFLFLAAKLLYAETLVTFSGNADVLEKAFKLSLRFKNESAITIEVTPRQDGRLSLHGKIDHMKIPFFDISSELDGNVATVQDENSPLPRWQGMLESKYSLINYKPVSELTVRFKIKDKRLFFEPLAWGNFVCDGNIGLLPPFDVDLRIQFTDITIDDLSFLSVVAGCPEENPSLTGSVSGKVQLSGFFDRLALKGRLRVVDGIVEGLVYDNIVLNFDGFYPILEISDSHITEENGLTIQLGGNLDLRNNCNLIQGVSALKMSPSIVENDVQRAWTIKRQKDTPSSSTEFKYRLNKDSLEKGSAKEESDMLSVEHKIEF